MEPNQLVLTHKYLDFSKGEIRHYRLTLESHYRALSHLGCLLCFLSLEIKQTAASK